MYLKDAGYVAGSGPAVGKLHYLLSGGVRQGAACTLNIP